MKVRIFALSLTAALALTGGIWIMQPGRGFGIPAAHAAEKPVFAPAPKLDAPSKRTLETAVFAGGCFWGVEGVFAQVNGVKRVVSGYTGGPKGVKVSYDSIQSGRTGFAEAVRVTYDPKVVSYATLMQVFFSVIADPTTLNFQGPDHGTQYRSALYPLTPAQNSAAKAYLAQLDAAKLWDARVVTAIERFTGFQDAEPYHQDFMITNPNHPYIRRWDAPKVAALKKMFPALVQAKPAR